MKEITARLTEEEHRRALAEVDGVYSPDMRLAVRKSIGSAVIRAYLYHVPHVHRPQDGWTLRLTEGDHGRPYVWGVILIPRTAIDKWGMLIVEELIGSPGQIYTGTLDSRLSAREALTYLKENWTKLPKNIGGTGAMDVPTETLKLENMHRFLKG